MIAPPSLEMLIKKRKTLNVALMEVTSLTVIAVKAIIMRIQRTAGQLFPKYNINLLLLKKIILLYFELNSIFGRNKTYHEKNSNIIRYVFSI
jgi:hypothetical protein